MTTAPSSPAQIQRPPLRVLIFDLSMILLLVFGAYFRFVGINWGENTFMHPDERFLVWVTADIAPVQNLSQYFDTAQSTLNPNNRGHGFYVYGTLPIFLTRYLVNSIFPAPGWEQITLVGRSLSALADLLTVLLIFAVAARLYSRRVALLASAFYALAVLPIQLSHFFKEDTFLTFFTFLAIYFAVRIMTEPETTAWKTTDDRRQTTAGETALDPSAANPAMIGPSSTVDRPSSTVHRPSSTFNPPNSRFPFSRFTLLSLGFGLAFGCAMACKINALPVAAMLPAAFALRILAAPRDTWERRAAGALGYLVLAGVVSLLVFRLLQPYAFSGPGFLGVKLNPLWVANIQEQRIQATGDVDFPPALQWARRPLWFAWQNLTVWGLGLPLGLLAWAGFLWAGWRMLQGDWQRHALLWGWTAFYFIWQSISFNPTMRYLLPIYPALAIFAAWAAITLVDGRRVKTDERRRTNDESQALNAGITPSSSVDDPSSSVIGHSSFVVRRPSFVLRRPSFVVFLILLSTLAYAFAFSGIYRRPFTRAAASRWVYQNVPGPINLRIQTEDGVYNQPLPYPAASSIYPDQPYITGFQAYASGALDEIYLGHVANKTASAQPASLSLLLSANPDGSQPLSSGALVQGSTDATLTLDTQVDLAQGQVYYLVLQAPEGQLVDICGPLVLHFQTPGGVVDQPLPTPAQCLVHGGRNLSLPFSPQTAGALSTMTFGRFLGLDANQPPQELSVAIGKPGEALATGVLAGDFAAQDDPRGRGYTIKLDKPLTLVEGETYQLSLSLPPGGGAVTLVGSSPAVESTWDDAIPLRMDGYDGYGGIYQGDLNFEMYWDDNPDKLGRFLNNLDRADYIFITSNRQWGTTTRVPERYPLTTEYYRRLLGCPPGRSVVWCYDVARVGTFKGDLGYELVQVFDSSPRLGPLVLNDQFAEEAFTVYDHPKVFIFKKSQDYNPAQVSAILRAVDLTKAVHITPRRAGSFLANLMLPDDRWNEQRQGGTWSQLFNINALQNRSQPLAVLLWYLSLGVLGLAVFPLLRLAFPGLADRGYPLARTAGLLLLSYLVWLAGSFRIPFSRPTIWLAVAALVIIGLFLAYRQRSELGREFRYRWRYYLLVEGLFLAFFLFDLLIRYGNPDLWHPYHGGEKPMDFSFFNAILKSTSFPPYDPWFAGGYLNYYYYGFVLVGVLVKALGIVPSVAYNLILPSVFALIAMGAFSLAWNLVEGHRMTTDEGRTANDERRRTTDDGILTGDDHPSSFVVRPSSIVHRPSSVVYSPPSSTLIPSLAAALGMAVFGNLGTVRMIWRGYQALAAPGGVIEGANIFTRWIWSFQGFLKVLGGAALPIGIGDWYWIPSRAIPAPGDIEPITEFPFFTVLYGDPHAHLFALPITLLVLAFALSVVLCRGRWGSLLGTAAGFFLGALAIGALRPTNTWDFYPYLPLAGVAVGYGLWSSYCSGGPSRISLRSLTFWRGLRESSRRAIVAAGGVLLLAVLSLVLFQPYAQWYGQGYGKIQAWQGTHTPTASYLVHWGLFLFVIVSWMTWETRDWMASTPVSALRKLDPYKGLLQALAGVLLVAVLALVIVFKAAIAWLVLPLMVWAGILILRPGQSDARRFVLFLVGTALALTLMVELVVLVGDIGRMNTVFKFYLMAWTLFAISAAASLGWLLDDLPLWWPRWRNLWGVALALLVFSAALYPLMGGLAKVKNRAVPDAPHTLDGMAFMADATYAEEWGTMDLGQDYDAIRWMLENVSGSPVIVEGNQRNLYRWGSRFSIYTGLPGVVGWEWHEQQQRALLPPNWVTDRIFEINNFYTTVDFQAARDFLRKYDVKYIILGQQERGLYPGPGLDKFPAANGVLWREVYHQGDTVIYEVIGDQ